MPIAIVRDSEIIYSLETSADGTLNVTGTADIPVYTAVPMDQLQNNDVNSMVNMIMANGGLDFTILPSMNFLTG
jgi:hypothetical protein